MGNCIICGTSTDGPVCDVHQEDVVFDFEGDEPSQLTAGRYYRGTVDGYADFGVFVNIGNVTGLLHRSKLDRRLESLDWEPGDEVFVQVNNVRDNGDIDLGWSIRQSEREFRGVLVDAPDGDYLLDEAEEDEAGNEAEPEPTADEQTGGNVPEEAEPEAVSEEPEAAEPETEAADEQTGGEPSDEELAEAVVTETSEPEAEEEEEPETVEAETETEDETEEAEEAESEE
ncbi:S1 RNA-binding domain-containing protein, partial [Natronomonas sp.]|uniref:S1 RNA-binding domain-containing protein n=1 Tax=Natronomonas sp. TaxID=2184060 RepID=UPI002FC35F5F